VSEEEAIIRRKMLELMRGGPVVQPPCPRGIVHCDRSSFEELLRRCKVVLADFWAEWCGPCRMLEPIVEDIARRYTPRIAVAKINVDENGDLAFEYGVMSIPTLIVFRNGVEVKRIVGYYPGLARELVRTLDSLIGS